MTTYLIGDLHGCYNELLSMLKKIHFNYTKDMLWITGDIIARGPDSIKLLYFLYDIRHSIKLVLGNHDLYFIALSVGIKHKCNLYDQELLFLLKQPHILDIINNWLKFQPLIQYNLKKKILMTHAGITPQWNSFKIVLSSAREVEQIISSHNSKEFFSYLYHYPQVTNWDNNQLQGFPRYSFIVNSFTNMRYCYSNGTLEMLSKDVPEKVTSLLKPWFLMSNILYKKYTIFFGHWSTLQGKYTPKNIIGLDTGCCWGHKLTLFSLEEKKFFYLKCNHT
ncbi:symmetrical bis(5'-nucleosyl)-tetraphosphatase [Enterobacteriaceae endosymbiont of Macroplea appendiculata]|uniref:symmetrical bis(5'-nucleosyl)-tetraphosphatase n=1 Tax=Enterobacteriaceae endosymbiont of Macroplea appendiculata TaxID=2675790 RepID=UPI00144903DB|nr:symmetrical bis(5'-nucleosyl)-tetraphosphatase [Enterobacteriaceae endosymbiont of Macroplea appendiculata]QJC30784.1 symmetrical bis(5'-nucleosyl)-tetraphosphatase [Enterobacteriaceae endosymbiont of Macroplea appendiculata]